MNCQNCGAPMQLIRDRDYFFCEYCSAFFFPRAGSDGVRVLEEPADLRCPLCREHLVTASVEDFRVLYCRKCRGVLASQESFPVIVRSLRAKEAERELAPRRLDPLELDRKMACPSCHRIMSTHPYAGPGNIIIDNCSACRIVWLDYGELGRISRAPGKDRLV